MYELVKIPFKMSPSPAPPELVLEVVRPECVHSFLMSGRGNTMSIVSNVLCVHIRHVHPTQLPEHDFLHKKSQILHVPEHVAKLILNVTVNPHIYRGITVKAAPVSIVCSEQEKTRLWVLICPKFPPKFPSGAYQRRHLV